VILPTYNRAGVLPRAIDSVVAQTLDDWELIVVDDASDDDVASVLAGYRDPRMRYVRRAVNGGVAAAQNTGIDHARGRFVAFLHSDDEFLPAKLECQVGLLSRAPASVGAAESGLDVVWGDRQIQHWSPGLDGADARDVLAYRARVHISGLLVRREVAVRLRFDEHLRGAEDRDFCIRLVETTRLAFVTQSLSRVYKTGPRLGRQNKGPIYAYLLEKYGDVIASDRRMHADWHYRIARAFARADQMPDARRSMRRSVALDPTRARRWMLWVASFGGDAVCRAAFRAQVSAADPARRARPRRNGERPGMNPGRSLPSPPQTGRSAPT